MSAHSRASVDDRTCGTRSTAVDRAADVEQWLRLMNQAIDESSWRNKQEALAAAMRIDKAYLSRLRSGEKPWRIEHIVALPDEIEARFEQLRAEHFDFIVVKPSSAEDAPKDLVAAVLGLLQPRLPAKADRMARVEPEPLKKVVGRR